METIRGGYYLRRISAPSEEDDGLRAFNAEGDEIERRPDVEDGAKGDAKGKRGSRKSKEA